MTHQHKSFSYTQHRIRNRPITPSALRLHCATDGDVITMHVIDGVHCLQQLEVFFFPLLIGHLEQTAA